MSEAVELQEAHALFERIRSQSADAPGVTRISYGDGENFAHAQIAQWAHALTLEVEHDAAGNQYVTLPGRDRSQPKVIMGSHMDSVRHGGNFDGAAGVVSAMAAVHRLVRLGCKPERDLTVMCIRAEEIVWFPCHYAGSRMAFGLLDASLYDELRRSDSGRTLAQHIDELGFDAEALRRGAAYLNRASIHCYLEVHIEQGPVLLRAGKPLGVVTGIRGNLRYRYCRIDGAYSHAGGIPRTYRQDAVFAFVEFAHGLEARCRELEAAGHDVVYTVGEAFTEAAQHAITKVPGRFDFKMDIRSMDNALLTALDQSLRDDATRIAAARNVGIDLGEVTNAEPAVMDPNLRSRFWDCIDRRGFSAMDIGSGGGHDCAVFASQGVPSAMLFIRNDGGSHNPEESMELGDFDDGVTVLAEFLQHEFCEA